MKHAAGGVNPACAITEDCFPIRLNAYTTAAPRKAGREDYRGSSNHPNRSSGTRATPVGYMSDEAVARVGSRHHASRRRRRLRPAGRAFGERSVNVRDGRLPDHGWQLAGWGGSGAPRNARRREARPRHGTDPERDHTRGCQQGNPHARDRSRLQPDLPSSGRCLHQGLADQRRWGIRPGCRRSTGSLLLSAGAGPYGWRRPV